MRDETQTDHDRRHADAAGRLLFWGLCGACAQYLFRTEHVTSNFLVPWRMTLAGALLLGWHLVRSPKQLLGPWRSGRDALQLLLYAIFGMAMCQYAYFATIELSNAGTATVLQYAAPAMLLLVVCCLERRWPGRIEVLAVVCASAGVFVFGAPWEFWHPRIFRQDAGHGDGRGPGGRSL